MWQAILSRIFKAREKVAGDMQAASRRAAKNRKAARAGGADDDDLDEDGVEDEDDEGYNDVEKPFLDHLDDLRKTMVGIILTLVVGLIICFSFNAWLLKFFQAPLGWIDVDKVELVSGEIAPVLDADGEQVRIPLGEAMGVTSIEVIGTFMLAIRVSIIAAIILGFPVLLYFLLDFILPGLKRKERKALYWALAVGMGLFLAGAAFCYAIVTPRVLEFFYYFGVNRGIKVEWIIEDYVKFVTRLILIFGISFELPVVVMALVKIDVLNYRLMSTTRSYAAVLITLVAAIITPTHDLLTLSLLAVPMYMLYEICIWLAWFIERRDRKLHPEFYEDLNEDVVVKDDWDRDDYDPWAELAGRDQKEEADAWHLDDPVPGEDGDGDDDNGGGGGGSEAGSPDGKPEPGDDPGGASPAAADPDAADEWPAADEYHQDPETLEDYSRRDQHGGGNQPSDGSKDAPADPGSGSGDDDPPPPRS